MYMTPTHPLQQSSFDFNGPSYNEHHDKKRLTGQCLRVFNLMKDGKWRTLDEIQSESENRTKIKDSQASISAQLRHLRKDRFGSHTVDHRARGDRSKGLFEYQLIPHPDYKEN